MGVASITRTLSKAALHRSQSLLAQLGAAAGTSEVMVPSGPGTVVLQQSHSGARILKLASLSTLPQQRRIAAVL